MKVPAENSTTPKPYYIYIVSVRIQKTPENTICHLFRCYAPKVNHLVMMQLCPEFTSFNQKLWGFVFLDYSWSCLSSKKCFQLCKHDQNSELSKNWMMPCYDLFSNGSDVNELWKQKHSNLESRFKLAILSRDLSVCGSHQYFIIQCFTFTGWINTLIGHVTSLILALILGSKLCLVIKETTFWVGHFRPFLVISSPTSLIFFTKLRFRWSFWGA